MGEKEDECTTEQNKAEKNNIIEHRRKYGMKRQKFYYLFSTPYTTEFYH